MTHDQKITYMKMAAGLSGFHINHEHLDLLVSTYELILEKKGATDLMDCGRVEVAVKKRAEIAKKSELLDKFSKKKK